MAGLMLGCDPKFFFGETVDIGVFNTDTASQLDPVDRSIHFTSHRSGSDSPSPATSINAINDPLYCIDISAHKSIPAHGPWGVIPSRSVMISNLPKTTQLWTLVELLKVICSCEL